MAAGDADGAVAAVLALDDAITAWSSDTLQSDEMDRARAAAAGDGRAARPGRDARAFATLATRVAPVVEAALSLARGGAGRTAATTSRTCCATSWRRPASRCATPAPAWSGSSERVRDRAGLGALGEPGVLGEDAATCSGAGAASSRPGGGRARRRRRAGRWRLLVDVDDDAVAVLDERDRPAVDRLGRDVADAEALGAAARTGRR